MFDTMTMTKTVGALCGMFLIFLFGNWAAETIYHVGGDGHGEGHEQAYVIDTGEGDDHGEEEEIVEIDYAAVMAAADPSKGEKLFKPCGACHKAGEFGKGSTGPQLSGVVGRAVGSVEGFGYSGKLVAVAETWSAEELIKFLENPKAYAPGTKMNFKGIKKIADRASLVAWLDSLDG